MADEAIRHLYAHIPFCPAKCPYCAFVTHVGSLRLVEPYVEALCREIDRLASMRPGGPLDTVYLGGGTPSLLTAEQIGRILGAIRHRFDLSPNAEISLEAHPSTVDAAKLGGYREIGVTRISFGGESLNAAELALLGRGHDGLRVTDAVAAARAAGFESVNVDLMYGLPGQSLRSWQQTVSKLLTSAPDHVSLYPLSVEPQTVFARRQRAGKLSLPADETVAEMYHVACNRLTAAGYIHYEVANWALPDHACRHNLSYWYNREFYAAGVGAHAYLRPYRTENMRQVGRYVERMREGGSPVRHREYIDPALELSETVMLRLRLLQDGLDLAEMTARYGSAIGAQLEARAMPLVRAGLMRHVEGRLILQEEAVPVANEIWQRFIGLGLPAAA